MLHQFLLQLNFSWQDWFALSFFTLSWGVYAWHSDHAPDTLSRTMDRYRLQWMQNMVNREIRLIDSNVQQMQVHGVTFFSSTSLLMIGGMVALLGATDQAFAVMADLPLIRNQSVLAWEVKVLLMLLIFVYSFFKFAWAFRQFNYVTILIGASPEFDTYKQDRIEYATRLGHLHAIAGRHMNKGIRSYYFALSVLGWWLHPLVWVAITMWIILVLYRREFLGLFRAELLR